MKITKTRSSIQSNMEVAEDLIYPECEIIEPCCENICDDSDLCAELGVLPCPKELACLRIKEAIDNLAEVAHEDEIARDAIANLSVVLLDLK